MLFGSPWVYLEGTLCIECFPIENCRKKKEEKGSSWRQQVCNRACSAGQP